MARGTEGGRRPELDTLVKHRVVNHAFLDNCLPDAFRNAAAAFASAWRPTAPRAPRRSASSKVRTPCSRTAGRVRSPSRPRFRTAPRWSGRIGPTIRRRRTSTRSTTTRRGGGSLRSRPTNVSVRHPRALSRSANAGAQASLELDSVEAWRVWSEALAQLQTILSDPAAGEIHAPARALQARARAHAEPRAQARRLAIELATQQLGDTLGAKIDDYTPPHGRGSGSRRPQARTIDCRCGCARCRARSAPTSSGPSRST